MLNPSVTPYLMPIKKITNSNNHTHKSKLNNHKQIIHQIMQKASEWKKEILKSLLDILTLIVYVDLCVNFVTKVMTAHEKVFNNPRRFKSLTSLIIDILLPPFETKWEVLLKNIAVIEYQD